MAVLERILIPIAERAVSISHWMGGFDWGEGHLYRTHYTDFKGLAVLCKYAV